jgi:hypothetical protein
MSLSRIVASLGLAVGFFRLAGLLLAVWRLDGIRQRVPRLLTLLRNERL